MNTADSWFSGEDYKIEQSVKRNKTLVGVPSLKKITGKVVLQDAINKKQNNLFSNFEVRDAVDTNDIASHIKLQISNTEVYEDKGKLVDICNNMTHYKKDLQHSFFVDDELVWRIEDYLADRPKYYMNDKCIVRRNIAHYLAGWCQSEIFNIKTRELTKFEFKYKAKFCFSKKYPHILYAMTYKKFTKIDCDSKQREELNIKQVSSRLPSFFEMQNPKQCLLMVMDDGYNIRTYFLDVDKLELGSLVTNKFIVATDYSNDRALALQCRDQTILQLFQANDFTKPIAQFICKHIYGLKKFHFIDKDYFLIRNQPGKQLDSKFNLFSVNTGKTIAKYKDSIHLQRFQASEKTKHGADIQCIAYIKNHGICKVEFKNSHFLAEYENSFQMQNSNQN